MPETLLLLACALPTDARSQETNPAQPPSNPGKKAVIFGTNADLQDSGKDRGADLGVVDAKPEGGDSAKKKGGEFAVAPLPMVNPSIGNGGGAAVLYARRFGTDEKVPASTFGAAGFYTETGSWMLGAGVRLYLAHDRFRILGGAGGGQFNYNFFGIGSDAGQAGLSIPLAQRSRAFLVEPKIRVLPHTYLGPRYHLITNHTSLNESGSSELPIPLPDDVKFQTAALGIRAQRDTSENPFYPMTGSLLDLTADFFGPAVGGDRTYQNGTLSFNKYFLVAKKNVFAMRATGCTASTSTPFFDVCQLGWPKDIRGYQIGQYRDLRMLVGQAEYRRELPWRLGAAAFAGAGSVGKTFGEMGNPEPGGGFGLRFLLAKENHINLRFDYAWGDNSHGFYVSLGEAF